jgi:hypothetical protein
VIKGGVFQFFKSRGPGRLGICIQGQAVDRKRWVINGLVQSLSLAQRTRPNAYPTPAQKDPPLSPVKRIEKQSQKVL